MSWSAAAPSNLALIKYMGKAPSSYNEIQATSKKSKNIQKKPESTFSHYLYLPIELINHLSPEDENSFWFKNMALNPSLSYTLPHFISKVKIEESSTDSWTPFKTNVFKQKLYHSSHKLELNFSLSSKEQKKFLDFFKFLKAFFKIPGHYIISSQNNFPKSAGTASSASSFSALTIAVYNLAQDNSLLEKEKLRLVKKTILANLSRVGSGSSCRSFFSPWCIWDNYKVYSFDTPLGCLYHQLILVESKDKKISSSLAHERVNTSFKLSGRANRVYDRIHSLKTSLNLTDWKNCFKIVKEEFLDMHSLFESSQPAFSYQNKKTEKVISFINDFWKKRGDGPLITMDAGPNIHLLYRKDQKNMRLEVLKSLSEFTILSSL